MKNTIILLFLIFLISGCSHDDYKEDFLLETLFENNDKRLLDYSAVKNEDKHLFWGEEFDNNDSKWPLDATDEYSDATVFLEDGKMLIDYYGKTEILFFDIPVNIDENKNFELEMKIYLQAPPRFLCYFYNPKDILSDYALILNNSKDILSVDFDYWGNIVYDDKTHEGWLSMISIPASNLVYLGDYNLTTIRKIGMKYSIFVNGKYIYTISKDKFSCNPTFFTICKGINKLDYFRISYIES